MLTVTKRIGCASRQPESVNTRPVDRSNSAQILSALIHACAVRCCKSRSGSRPARKPKHQDNDDGDCSDEKDDGGQRKISAPIMQQHKSLARRDSQGERLRCQRCRGCAGCRCAGSGALPALKPLDVVLDHFRVRNGGREEVGNSVHHVDAAACTAASGLA